jgi:hypothetical protein
MILPEAPPRTWKGPQKQPGSPRLGPQLLQKRDKSAASLSDPDEFRSQSQVIWLNFVDHLALISSKLGTILDFGPFLLGENRE